MLEQQSETKDLTWEEPFFLEGGGLLPEVTIRYTCAGELNNKKDNVVWVFHALTANSDPFEWWPGLFGANKVFDPEEYFIVCANVLGSCYGSTEPKDNHFPLLTIRDIVRGHDLLRDHLGVESIRVGIGGSLGGQQLFEWAVQ